MTGKLATCTEEHHWSSSRSSKRNLTENPLFCTWSSPPPPESSEMGLRSVLSWTQEMYTSASGFPPAVPPCWGTEASPLLSAWTQPRYPEARALTALRKESSRQLVTEPRLKAKHPSPADRGGGGALAPPAAAGRERAAPCSQSPEGSPRSSSAESAQTGSPNPNGAK